MLLGLLLLCTVALGAGQALAAAPPAPSLDANLKAFRLAIEDLSQAFAGKYARGPEFLKRLEALEKQAAGGAGDPRLADEFRALQREALLANPLIDFDRLLLVKRDEKQLGLPQNWQGNCALPKTGYNNEIAVLSPVSPDGKLTTLYQPDAGKFVGDVDLAFDADKMLFSSIGEDGRWHVFEMGADGKNLRRITPSEPEVDWYDPCYLPDGRIICASTAVFHGVPCVTGSNTVANCFRMDADGKNVRQLGFDQDHNWCPTVMNDGRVMYSRWEYSDAPHYFSRLLFRMNPDGTGQMEYYGSNSYWPNSIFYARPIPGHPTKVVAVISGHHGVPRMGELLIFDPARGRHEADGVVQRIPGYGKKVEPIIVDNLVDDSWPKFLHPYPLSDKYFLVSCKPNDGTPWGLYLVDVFDNMLLIIEMPGYALFEPVPFRKTPRPPVVPDRVNLQTDQATVYLTDIYSGPGLKGVPRGTVKRLRLYEYHYAYPGMGGHINIGIDGPWDVHRILGTVPVLEDGSAVFKVPANMPIAVQPLDEKGQAIQVMRSWFTAMPGEVLSCVGCHEKQNAGPPPAGNLAARTAPAEIVPWYGPARGFSFKREVQPVLDRYCVGCHNGQQGRPNFTVDCASPFRNFTSSYCELHPYVRRPGPESDYRLQKPYEFHAGTSPLIQMHRKGHHNVRLDDEAWDRLITWIDLNVPDHGTWGEHQKIAGNYHDLRLQMRTKYANQPEDPEKIFNPYQPGLVKFVPPAPERQADAALMRLVSWTFNASEAKKRQEAAGLPSELKVDLGGGKSLELVLVPAGEFVMGDGAGFADEQPLTRAKIGKPFYLGKFEVTNAQYALFDPNHESGYISMYNKDHATRGEPAEQENRPVIRVSWKEAMAFCDWLSMKTGKRFSLPTEAQWEYACRAGTATPLSYGDASVDFGKLANLADEAVTGLLRGDSPKWIPCASKVNDGAVVTESVGKWAPNPWGLYDMHGNAAEWTLSTYKPYPYDAADGRNDAKADGLKVVRGGSFYDRPAWARSALRLAYEPYQAVFDVGFRVVCEADAAKVPANVARAEK